MNYFITKPAELDLIEIQNYIASNNIDAANKLIDKFFDIIRKLATNPKMGSKRPDLTDEDVLFWCLKHYLIVYRINNSNIEILRVLSNYRNIASLLSG